MAPSAAARAMRPKDHDQIWILQEGADWNHCSQMMPPAAVRPRSTSVAAVVRSAGLPLSSTGGRLSGLHPFQPAPGGREAVGRFAVGAAQKRGVHALDMPFDHEFREFFAVAQVMAGIIGPLFHFVKNVIGHSVFCARGLIRLSL